MTAPGQDLHDCGGCGISYPALWPRCPVCRTDRAVTPWDEDEPERTTRGCLAGIVIAAVLWGLILGAAYWLSH